MDLRLRMEIRTFREVCDNDPWSENEEHEHENACAGQSGGVG